MEWKECTVGQVVKTNISQYSIKENWKDIIYLDTGNITQGKIDSLQHFSNEDKVPSRARRKVKQGDIIYSCVRPNQKHFGYIENPPSNLLVSTGFVVITCIDVDSKYLYYYLTQDYITDFLHAVGEQAVSTYPTIRPSDVESVKIKIPNKVEDQRRIAAILSSLDRKIELNNKINAQLEEMAQAIFKNWFVDFEPFKEGKFVESELGMIPEGWRVEKIENLPHTLETGRRPKGGALDNGIPSVGAEHVKGMCAYDYSKNKYIDYNFASKLKTGKIKGYELLIYKDGGKPGYFIPNFSIFGEGYPFEICYLNEHVFKLDFQENRGFNIFCYFYFKTEQIMAYFNSQGAKAAIPGINKKDVESLYVLSPDNKEVAEFGKIVLPMFTQMLKNANENKNLAQLRDTLLPKLMSGEIELGPSEEEQLKIIDEMFAGLKSEEPINMEGEPIASLSKLA